MIEGADTCFKAVNKLTERIGDRRLDVLLDQMDETGYKVGAEEEDVFRQEEEIRKRRKEESENVEAVEDEEVKNVFDVCFKMFMIMSRSQPGHPSGARQISWSMPRRETGAG